MTNQPPDPLLALGWDERVEARYAALAASDRAPGRVVRVERATSLVTTAAGDVVARTPLPVAVGDWIALYVRGGDATVVDVVPRWSQLDRRHPMDDRIQVLAANVDVVLVTAPADRLSPSRVEREVVLGWESGATPVVLLTKADLDTDRRHEALQERVIGVDVVPVSAVDGTGLDTVIALLQPRRTAVFLGPSGAGKSTLTNALLGEDVMATADVRAQDHRGRHTTSVRQLLVLPSGGLVIDTPGLRSLGLWRDGDGMAATFSDVDELAAGCRFADCRHEGEPGCAVVAAVSRGSLPTERLASYRKLRRELAFEARRHDPLARRDARRWGRTVAREARRRARP